MRFTTSAFAILSTAVVSSAAPKPRSDCRAIEVQPGDSCGSLASKCGVTPTQFTDYNKRENLCSTLYIGELVCCSGGSLPSRSPKPSSDGSCSIYDVKAGDSCSQITASHHLTQAQLFGFNMKTWGWDGCNRLVVGQRICLSEGEPPLPAPVQNAACGPQVPNTPKPPAGTDLSQLNQCPEKACCNIWGQCGSTDEFCIASKSSTGNPGTAAPGTNGCISNCKN